MFLSNRIFFKSLAGLILCSSLSSATVTGNTFRDFNGDGIQQAGEFGRGGIVVKAYSNVIGGTDTEVGETTTLPDGSYTLPLSDDQYPVRLEYTIPTGLCNLDASQDYPAANGNTYGTDVQFAMNSGEVHNFVFNYPADFSVDENPRVFLPKHGNGDPLAGGDVATVTAMTSFHYLDHGHAANSGRGATDGPAYDVVANASQLGTVYGVAYSRQAQKVFTSAFLKRHAGMGPLGGGGIYVIDANASFDTTADLGFLDLDELGIATSDEMSPYTDALTAVGSNVVTFSPVIGTNTERGMTGNKGDPSKDSAAWSQVGKLSLGDLDISEDGQYLYTINLYDRKLYEIDLTDPKNPVAPTAGNSAEKIKSFDIPDTCTEAGAGEYRPFALKVARGKVFVGITCSGENADGSLAGGTAVDMKGSIYEFDVATDQWANTPEFEFTFDYRDADKPWHTWGSAWNADWEYGEPLISDIEFDGSGNMLIGIMDRTGHKKGRNNYDLNGAGSYSSATVGELLRAVRDTGSQTCAYNITTNPEFYNDNLQHTESSQGALAVHRTSTFDGVLSTFMDPIDIWSAGVVLYDNSDGGREQEGYEIFYSTDVSTFGKSGGLGDLEVMEKVPSIEIGNLVWFDSDNDGIQDANESGIEGVDIELVDSLGTVVSTTTTDVNGGYYFNHTNVGTGSELGPQANSDYTVRIKSTHFNYGKGFGPLDNKALTISDQVGAGKFNQSDSDAHLNAGIAEISVRTKNAGENDHSYDFGFIIGNGSLGDRVWYDKNADGIQDPNEDGIQDVTATLYEGDCLTRAKDYNHIDFPTVNTDVDGFYRFEDLDPADYCIGFSNLPAGHIVSPQNVGSDDTQDSDVDALTKTTGLINLVAGENNISFDMGLYEASSIGDYVWYDDNVNGIQDATETGVEGVTVTLYMGDCSTTVAGVPAIQTSSTGAYAFTNLMPDDYCLGFSNIPADYKVTPKEQGVDSTKDSDVNLDSNKTISINLESGENDLSWDMGIYQLSSIGDYVWYDNNGNGIQDIAETGVQGITATLFGSDCTTAVTGVAPIITDANGFYQFKDLLLGEYCVGFTGIPAGYAISPQNQGGDNELNSDVNVATGKTMVTTLQRGENDLSWDMGIYEEATIGNFVWNDKNANGKQDGGENGVDAVTVTLYGSDCTTRAKDSLGVDIPTTATDASGLYTFEHLMPSEYCLGFSNIPVGLHVSPKDMGEDGLDSDVNTDTNKTISTLLEAGENDTSWDMGLYEKASIGDRVWFDNNVNGIQDGNESGVANVGVTLYEADCSTVAVAEITTDANGAYNFDGLTPSDYCVGFNLATLPVGYKVTTQNVITTTDLLDSDVDPSTGKTQSTNLEGGESDTSWDMGIYKPASIGDKVWLDSNANGIQESNESGVANVTVTLYEGDCSTVVTVDSNGGAITPITTDGLGNYTFTNLIPSDYCVGFSNLPANHVVTPMNSGLDDGVDSDVNPITKKAVATILSSGESDTSWDMGIYEPASIGNKVWLDSNANGIQENNESGVANVTVTLYEGDCSTVVTVDDSGNAITTETTDANGLYNFGNLTPKEYCVGFDNLPAEYKITTQDGGNDNGVDSDVNLLTQKAVATTLSSGESDTSWDMGIYKPATIGNFVWNDVNANGVQDNGEVGVANITITLYGSDCSTIALDESGNPIATTMTDNLGVYGFANLTPSNYCVGFSDIPAMYTIAPMNNGDVNTDSDVNPTTSKTVVTTLSSGENDTSWDMGLYEKASIGDRVWFDNNVNGIQDGNESGVANVGVTLYEADCSTVAVAEITTDANGAYNFDGLTPSDYCVGFNLATLPVGYKVTTQNVITTTDLLDSDVDPSTGKTQSTNLEGGESDTSWDMGIYKPASIGDKVWLDSNANGIQESNESGVANVTVTLYDKTCAVAVGHDALGNVIAPQVTDNNGYYNFMNLIPREYCLGFSSIPTGYVVSPSNQGSDNSDSDVNPISYRTITTTLVSGENDGSWDMGLYEPASIGNVVWLDTNGNGIKDANETGVKGVSVTLYKGDCTTIVTLDNSGETISKQITNANGIYNFGNLTPSEYCLGFELPAGYEVSPQNQGDEDSDSDVNPMTQKAVATTLSSGESDTHWYLGIYQPATIGNVVWDDKNANGLQDNNEIGVSDVNVTLYNGDCTTRAMNRDGTILPNVTTDANGVYTFTNLMPNDYCIGFTIPTGYVVSPQNSGDDNKDSDVNPATNRAGRTTLSSNETDSSWDMGIYQPATLGDKVWLDTNRDGIQDANESGVKEVKVTLYAADCTTALKSLKTDVKGNYLFTNLVPNTYCVGFSEIPEGYVLTAQDIKNDTTDSDAKRATGKTIVTTLESGEHDMTWDAGIYKLSSIGDYVWYDENKDGLQNTEETPVADVKVTLYESDCETAIKETRSDSTGHYLFDNLEPNEYCVGFDELPTGYQFTPNFEEGEDRTLDCSVDPGTGKTPIINLAGAYSDMTWDMGIIPKCKDEEGRVLKVFDDEILANTNGDTTTINILANDHGNLDIKTIRFVSTKEGAILWGNGTAVGGTSIETTDTLVVAGEGVWTVKSDGTITFKAEAGFTGIPTPVYYIIQCKQGDTSNLGQVKIISNCVCETYEKSVSDSVATLNTWGILFTLFLTSLLAGFLFRKEIEHHQA